MLTRSFFGARWHRLLHGAVLPFAALLAALSGAADTSKELWDASRQAIYQIRVVEAESGEKSTIGSGFQIDENGLIATNFHVVSAAVHEPEKYRLELTDTDGGTAPLTLVDFDVIHDLALVRRPQPKSGAVVTPLDRASDLPQQGDPVFAVGNPYDLGQAIVPGTYNGLLEASFYQKLLFSGSLNPGMSGGPALSQDGLVVGVNVATMGNQISFLVPISYLNALVDDVSEDLLPTRYKARVAEQLHADQAAKFAKLLSEPWPTQRLGAVNVGASLEAYFKCWGNTRDDDDDPIVLSQTSCTSQDSIYVSRSIQTGLIDYEYAYISTDEMSSLRFYRWVSSRFSGMNTRSRVTKDDATNYQCEQDTLRDDLGSSWRTVFCVRAYRDVEDFYDVVYQATALGRPHETLTSHFALSGVSRANARAFTNRFETLQSWR